MMRSSIFGWVGIVLTIGASSAGFASEPASVKSVPPSTSKAAEDRGITLKTIAAKQGSAIETVQSVMKRGIGLLEEFRSDLKSTRKDARVKKLVNEEFLDYERLLRESMGRHWEVVQKNPKKKARLISVFTSLISHNYLAKLSEYDQGRYTVKVIEEKSITPRTADVVTQVVGPDGVEVGVVFRMAKAIVSAPWRCFDVQLDETSLVSAYRGAFNAIMTDKNGGIDTIISRMESKLEKVKKAA